MNSGDLNGILPAESDLCILRPGIEIKAGLQVSFSGRSRFL